MSTPLIAGRAVVALDRWGHLVGVDVVTGDLLWSVDLPEDLGSRRPNQGFVTSPVLVDGTVVVQTGAGDAAVAGFDPATGTRLWAVGSDQNMYQTPVPVSVGDRRQLVAAGQTQVMGIDPRTGELLWQYAHGGDGFTGVESLVPVPAGPDRIFLSHKHHSSALVKLTREDASVVGREQWDQPTIKNSYAVPIFHDGYVYGFSSRFLTCIDAETGEAAWKSRAPGDGFLILVDAHLVILTKDGTLHVAKASPDGYDEVASLDLFDDVVWTTPSFANGHIYVRSYEELARVDIRSLNSLTTTGGVPADALAREVALGRFERFLMEVDQTDRKGAVVDHFLESIDQFPLIERENRVHFMYRGPGADLAIAGDLIGARTEAPMTRVADTDLFYYSTEVAPDARVNYHFIRDYVEITDPRNPRETVTEIFGPDMELLFLEAPMPVSWMSMPGWQAPAHLVDPPPNVERGRVVTHDLESEVLGSSVTLHVYVPGGYEERGQRYPVAYYHDGNGALTLGRVPTSLDNLLGMSVRPLIAVFIEAPPAGLRIYAEMWADELVPFIDTTYRTIAAAEGRASLGVGFSAQQALYVALTKPEMVRKVSVQSLGAPGERARTLLAQLVQTAAEQPMDFYIDWGLYDVRAPLENWDLRQWNRDLVEVLETGGYTVAGGEVPDGTGWSSWKNRTDRVLRSLFPLD